MNWFCFFYCLQLVLTTVEAATCLFNLGAYLSDTDGSGSATPAPGYACDATLTCPTGMVVGITLLRGSLDTDALKFYDSTKDAINPEDLLLWNPFVCRYPPCGPASDSKMLTSNRVRVNYVSGSGNGFDLTYSCYTGQCTSNYTDFRNGSSHSVAPNEMYSSDTDGDGATKSMP
eukprot:PhF_6_TR19815/c0_g1_i2/m.28890